jgi:hypothetical protein
MADRMKEIDEDLKMKYLQGYDDGFRAGVVKGMEKAIEVFKIATQPRIVLQRMGDDVFKHKGNM